MSRSTIDQVTVKMDSSQRSFAPCPTGTQHAVCVDVIDLGLAVEQYKDQPAHLVHKVVLVFQTDEENPETSKRYEPSIEFTIAAEYARGEGLKATFGPKSKLRKMLGGWRGRPYTDEEAKEGAPLHKLVGVNATLNVLHKVSKQERTYAVIDSISPPMKKQPKIVPHDYVRSEHWERRKAEYGAAVEKYALETPAPASTDFNEMPEALKSDDDWEAPF